jgi:transcriptional regulator with XRE-family HTH domain
MLAGEKGQLSSQVGALRGKESDPSHRTLADLHFASMTAGLERSIELGDFLKARRAELTPAYAGLPETGGQRRVPGLRREEVAQLAAISVDYYTRLEQGRVPASAAVLGTLAHALLLSDDQRTYMYELAGKPTARSRRRTVQRVRPAVRRLLDQLTETPAIVLGRRMDILAWNSMATALYTDFEALPATRRNYVWLLFAHQKFRGLHVDWTGAARTAIAALRMEAASFPDDPQLATLVGELSLQDHDFRTWWASHQVASTSFGTKHYQHPVVGEITLDCDTWDSPDRDDQRLMVLTAEPGTSSHQALKILSSWAATRDVHENSRAAWS